MTVERIPKRNKVTLRWHLRATYWAGKDGPFKQICKAEHLFEDSSWIAVVDCARILKKLPRIRDDMKNLSDNNSQISRSKSHLFAVSVSFSATK